MGSFRRAAGRVAKRKARGHPPATTHATLVTTIPQELLDSKPTTFEKHVDAIKTKLLAYVSEGVRINKVRLCFTHRPHLYFSTTRRGYPSSVSRRAH